MTIDRKDWRKYEPPWIPIYFIDINELKRMLEESPEQLNPVSMELMLGYFEEFELYEKAAVIKAHKEKTPWKQTKDGWQRPLTAEEVQEYGLHVDDTWTDNGDGTWTKEIEDEDYDDDDSEFYEL